MPTLSNQLTNQVLRRLWEYNVYAWRQNTGGIFDRSKGVYRSAAKKGVSDILGLRHGSGQFVAVEIKTGYDRLRPEQVGFLRSVQDYGGIALVVHSLEEFEQLWKQQL